MLAALGFTHVQKQFFPLSERPELFFQLRMPEGSAIGASMEAAKQAEALLKGDGDAAYYASYIGRGPPRFWLGTNPAPPNESYSEIVIVAGSAAERLRALVMTIETMNAARYLSDRKLRDMVEAALNENWPIIAENIDLMIEIVIACGMKSGEFAAGDAKLAARLAHRACVRYRHPRMMVECAERPEPSGARMVDFCLRALRDPA